MGCPAVTERCPFCTFEMVYCAAHTPAQDVIAAREEHIQEHVEEMIEA